MRVFCLAIIIGAAIGLEKRQLPADMDGIIKSLGRPTLEDTRFQKTGVIIASTKTAATAKTETSMVAMSKAVLAATSQLHATASATSAAAAKVKAKAATEAGAESTLATDAGVTSELSAYSGGVMDGMTSGSWEGYKSSVPGSGVVIFPPTSPNGKKWKSQMSWIPGSGHWTTSPKTSGMGI